jgi:hypothetical protein
MADQTITPHVLTTNVFHPLATGDWEDLTSSNDGIVIPPPDAKLLFLAIDASGSCVLTFTHGNGVLASLGDVASGAMTISLVYGVVIETARCKWLSGSDKGYIRISTTQNVKVACYQLP